MLEPAAQPPGSSSVARIGPVIVGAGTGAGADVAVTFDPLRPTRPETTVAITVIVGDVGTGKSILGRRLIWQLAGQHQPVELVDDWQPADPAARAARLRGAMASGAFVVLDSPHLGTHLADLDAAAGHVLAHQGPAARPAGLVLVTCGPAEIPTALLPLVGTVIVFRLQRHQARTALLGRWPGPFVPALQPAGLPSVSHATARRVDLTNPIRRAWTVWRMLRYLSGRRPEPTGAGPTAHQHQQAVKAGPDDLHAPRVRVVDFSDLAGTLATLDNGECVVIDAGGTARPAVIAADTRWHTQTLAVLRALLYLDDPPQPATATQICVASRLPRRAVGPILASLERATWIRDTADTPGRQRGWCAWQLTRLGRRQASRAVADSDGKRATP